jgi:hypothetical protein
MRRSACPRDRRSRRLPIAAAALMLALGAAHADDDRFGVYGLAPAAAGQTVAEAERALGARLVAGASDAARPCHLRRSRAQPGVDVVVNRGLIVRMETRDPRWATLRGLRVGDSEAKARQIYGKRLTVVPHPYFARGHLLSVRAADGQHALVMESNDQGRIVTLRGGRLPAVEYLEGCS